MKPSTPPSGGGDDHTPQSRRPIRAVLDGCPVMLVPLPHGLTAIFDLDVWLELVRLGISPRFNVRTNGKSHAHPQPYVKVAAKLPRAIGGTSPTHQGARLVVALAMLDEEARTGVRYRGRWRVEHVEGDHLDLRGAMLRVLPAGDDQNGGFYALWDLRERRKLVAQGRSPNAVFAERRRASEASRKRRTGP